MTAKAHAEAQPESKPEELEAIAETFERRDFSDEELEAIRRTRRSTPR